MNASRLALIPLLALPLTACIQTHVIIDQAKPIDVNIHFSGNLDLVIHDARQDLEKVTGEKPINTVRPEDLGLPAAPPARSGSSAAPAAETFFPVSTSLARHRKAPLPPALAVENPNDAPRYIPIALKDDLQKKMAARNADVRALWDSKLVGESHTGLLVARGTLTDAQKKLVDEENADRSALYADEAAAKKVSTDEVALAYYAARIGYAKKGAWYEKRNPAGTWEWLQWDR